jgi:hypothetical protein
MTFSIDGSGLGLLRGEETQRGGRQGGAAQLYRLTPRDGATLQTRSQLVEGLVCIPRMASLPSSVFIDNAIPPLL